MMRIYRSIIGIIIVFFISFPGFLEAGGLSTDLGEVILEDLHIGESYSICEVLHSPLEVVNESDWAVELKVDILVPQEGELKDGYEPIPNTSWIRLEKGTFLIGPKDRGVTDIIISVPDDEQYLGKRYQVYIWSHTIGERLCVGLRSRILFSITPP